jgi:hypothetical protein
MTKQSSETKSRRRTWALIAVVTGIGSVALAGWAWSRQVARPARPPSIPATAPRSEPQDAARPDLVVPAVVPTVPTVGAPAPAVAPFQPELRRDGRRAKGQSLPKASQGAQKMIEPAEEASPRLRRGANDALIIE